jgi:hypothetical protein
MPLDHAMRAAAEKLLSCGGGVCTVSHIASSRGLYNKF